jgi:hypothetical protein
MAAFGGPESVDTADVFYFEVLAPRHCVLGEFPIVQQI